MRAALVLSLGALLLSRCACPDPGAESDAGPRPADGGGPGEDPDGGPPDGGAPDGGGTDGGACVDDDDCGNDTFCGDGTCAPWADGAADEACSAAISIDALVPEVQCAFTEPPPGDPSPAHNQVMSTPVVVDLDLDDNPATLRPSIVFVTFAIEGNYHAPGVVRVIDGATCEQQMSAPGVLAMSPAGPAVADITGDGRAEILLAADDPAAPGGILALEVDTSGGAPSLRVLWRSRDCTTGVPDATGGRDQWPGPSIFDLDDDGVPEVLYGAAVYGADGCLRGPPDFPAYGKGVVALAVDVDEDGAVELVQGDAMLEWNALASSWAPDPLFVNGGGARGQVAVADFGTFPIAALGGADVAEIAVVSLGTVRVQTVDGTVVFGPFPIAGGGTGGAPTAADFDGDGRVEVAAAAAAAYAVYDLDCVPGGAPGGCASARTDGVLWQQPVQDLSSNVTGSSIFDFDADGKAEVVYADECFLRIFEGTTGRVLFSSSRSSGTTYENPVIVDVDGDFKSEIVTSANDYAEPLGCAADDPLLPGTPHTPNHGIIVLRDAEDRWAASRPVWNQHAYFVTHTDDRGVVPATSAQPLNWRTPGLNNFRQNVQGDLAATGVGDLTARGETQTLLCVDGQATYAARVCNRGTLPVGAGTAVSFTLGDAELCRTTTAGTLAVGACEDVGCSGTEPPGTVDVTVTVDPDGTQRECHEGNNRGTLAGVSCAIIGG